MKTKNAFVPILLLIMIGAGITAPALAYTVDEHTTIAQWHYDSEYEYYYTNVVVWLSSTNMEATFRWNATFLADTDQISITPGNVGVEDINGLTSHSFYVEDDYTHFLFGNTPSAQAWTNHTTQYLVVKIDDQDFHTVGSFSHDGTNLQSFDTDTTYDEATRRAVTVYIKHSTEPTGPLYIIQTPKTGMIGTMFNYIVFYLPIVLILGAASKYLRRWF